MESINLRIENSESQEIEEISYSMSLKVPPKSDLLRLLPLHLSNLQYDWQCRTGILSKIEHSFKLCLYREYHEPKIGIFAFINNNERIIELRGVDISYVSSSSTTKKNSTTVEDNMTKLEPPKLMEIPGMEFWQSTIGWPDDSGILFLVLNIVKRKAPKIILDEVQNTYTNTKLDVKNYFLSTECSDVTLICGSKQFPAHLIVLCSKSKYFATMFNNSMKESKERIVKIEDMSPQGVKELLRFLYLGEIEQIICAKELFIAGDKYGMEDLKSLCERHLIENLRPENAIEMFDLCQMHGSSVLLRKSKQVLLWNKSKFAGDPETLKEFTCKYPELVFELLNFEG